MPASQFVYEKMPCLIHDELIRPNCEFREMGKDTVTAGTGYSLTRRGMMAASAGFLLMGHGASAEGGGRRSEEMRSIVAAMARDQGFQGIAMLDRSGQPEFSQPVGMADIAAGRPVGIDTSFGIGSISKRFTAVTVMRLVDRRLLALDEPIVAWLPWYRADTGARVTLRHLLSNTSGIPNGYGAALKANKALVAPELTTEEAVRRFASGDLAFDPGTRFDYAATNWYVVQAIIEVVTRVAYADAVRNLVIAPLSLRKTTLTAPSDAAKSYGSVSPPAEAAVELRSYQAAPGGYYSTGTDLLRFAHRVYDTGFLSSASRAALTTIEAASDSYALGGRVRQIIIRGDAVAAAWETGNIAGFRSVLGHRLDGKGAVVIFNNTAMSQRTMDEFAEALLATT